MIKRVAIIGAGLAGLAAGSELQGRCAVTLFDAKGVGAGASGVAAGLLHPYAGKYVRRSKECDEALPAAKRLLERAADALGRCISTPGVLRLPSRAWHGQEFARCIRRYDDLSWAENGALWIRSGLSVNIPLYLEGLWKLLEQRGVELRIQRVNQFEEQFDLVILAMGADLPVPLDRTKGQVLRLRWPTDLPCPQSALVGSKYLVMEEDNLHCLAGSTYERQFTTPLPDSEVAQQAILPELEAMVPGIARAEVVGCSAGVRAHSLKGYLPEVKQLGPKTYALAGLGSRGLLYHAWLAKRLAHLVLA